MPLVAQWQDMEGNPTQPPEVALRQSGTQMGRRLQEGRTPKKEKRERRREHVASWGARKKGRRWERRGKGRGGLRTQERQGSKDSGGFLF